MFLLSALLFIPVVSVALIPQRHDHSHTSSKRLPSTWYQRSDHSVHNLFRRGSATDGIVYAEVGSPTWSAAYPQSTPYSTVMPAEWLDALNAAIFPFPTNLPGENPTYPSGFDPNGDVVCSATYKCRNPGDIWDAPDGMVGISFDDGPQSQIKASDDLYDFLQSNNQTATHFMIGVNILQYPAEFLKAFNMGGDIAAHTYTHPYTTTLSNEDVVAQLGWSLELIHNSTGGRVTKFWRVMSSAAVQCKELPSNIIYCSTEDWSLTTGGTTLQAINTSMNEWITGPKTPGLIILEHELSNLSVAAFKAAYPVMKANGWNTESLAQIVEGTSAYQNSPSSSGPVTPADVILAAKTAPNTRRKLVHPSSSGLFASTTLSTSLQPNSASSSVRRMGSAAAVVPSGFTSRFRSIIYGSLSYIRLKPGEL
ncbi:glycoside hydrolase/deacetylase [Mycena metata]|uniref:chitin deacetylase n=1 Tax=Mycena metata TaxID=1033252 RepID=A0AAD7K9U8_9AGAR|nr:glycoside hydrolase/deacetylase [Mycena metata]